ncbi:Uncharacterized protein QTN25_005142 [Entamoeba marina]
MDITTEQVTNVGEHGQTKLNYYDTKMRYKNLKNEVHCLEKKKKVVLKEDIPAEEKESITNQLGSKQNELEQAKEFYYEIVGDDDSCPCDGCSYEIADCLQTPLDLTHNFQSLIAHCPEPPKDIFPLNITQQRSELINATNTFIVLNSVNAVVSKLAIKGDMALVVKKGKINVLCCYICATFSSLNDLFIGGNNLIDVKSLSINCSKVYPSSIHIAINSKLHSQKLSISGSSVLFTESMKTNMSGPLIQTNELHTTRPLSLQIVDRLKPQQCISIIQSPSLRKYPKTMKFNIDQDALTFIQLPVQKGYLVEGKNGMKISKYFEHKNKNVQFPCPHGFKCQSPQQKEYIILPMKDEQVIYPLEDIDKDYLINKTIVQPDELMREDYIYYLGMNSEKQIRIHFKHHEKYGVQGKKFGKKSKMVYQLYYNVSDMNLPDGAIVYSQEFKKKSDISFPLLNDEIITIPAHYFAKGGKYPLKNFEVWRMEGEDYMVLNKHSQLNMFSFYTTTDYKLTRVDDQLLVCNPKELKPKVVEPTVESNSTNTTNSTTDVPQQQEQTPEQELKVEV